MQYNSGSGFFKEYSSDIWCLGEVRAWFGACLQVDVMQYRVILRANQKHATQHFEASQ